jgi:hypothetical protein
VIKKILLLSAILALQSCLVTTHRVKKIETSKLKLPENKLGYTSFEFSSDIRKEKAKDWFRTYFDLNTEDDLVNFKTPLLDNSNHEFILSIQDYSDREQYIDLIDFFTEEKVETKEKSIQFFIGITVTDISGEDHLADNSIFQPALLAKLKVLRKNFKAYTVKNPDQKFFYGR